MYGVEPLISLEGLENKLKERRITFDSGIFSGGLNYPPQNSKEEKTIQTRIRKLIEVEHKLQASYTREEQLFYGHSFEFEVLINNSLLYPPADEQMIKAAEQRLQITLPPSYKDFLRVSNGFLNTFGRLLPVQEIGWLKDKDPEFLSIWGADILDIPDELYFVYGREQDTIHMRAEYMSSCLLIGNNHGFLGGGNWFLNPEIQLQPNEWEAWFMQDGDIGAMRYRNFKEQMEALYPRNIEYLNDYLDET
jgi:hypothetical protein